MEKEPERYNAALEKMAKEGEKKKRKAEEEDLAAGASSSSEHLQSPADSKLFDFYLVETRIDSNGAKGRSSTLASLRRRCRHRSSSRDQAACSPTGGCAKLAARVKYPQV